MLDDKIVQCRGEHFAGGRYPRLTWAAWRSFGWQICTSAALSTKWIKRATQIGMARMLEGKRTGYLYYCACWELLCKWSDSLLGASRMKPFATSTTTWSSIVAPLDALLRTRCNFFKINFWEDCLGSQNWHGKTALRRKRSRCHRATPKML